MPRPAKEPFSDVPQEFRDSVDAGDREEIRRLISQVALDQVELELAQVADEDYQRIKEQYKEAGAIYREGTKVNKLKIKYAQRVFEDKGG